MNTFDQIFIRLTKVVGLVLGSGIMIYETGWDHQDRPYLYAAALMMMGLQIAEVVGKVAEGLSRRTPDPPDLGKIAGSMDSREDSQPS